jgi:hypothetical protein
MRVEITREPGSPAYDRHYADAAQDMASGALPIFAGMRTGFERLAGYSGPVAGSGKEVDATSPAPLSVLHREDDPRARIGRRALSFVRATYPTGHCVPRVARFFLCVYH